MEALKFTPLFTKSPDVLHAVRKAYDLDDTEKRKESIDCLQEWVKNQPHFIKKDIDRDYLEIFLINNKGSVEKTKNSLEKNFSLKTLRKDFFKTETKINDFKEFKCFVHETILPKATQDHHIIIFHRNNINTILGTNFLYQYFSRTIFLLEYLFKYYYFMGVIIIIDYRNSEITKLLTNFVIRKSYAKYYLEILLEGYQLRVKQIHIISNSKLLNALLSFTKKLISSKIANRMIVHKDLESVYGYIDKDLLPADYGGKEKTLEELSTNLDEHLSSDEYIEYMNEVSQTTIDITKKEK